MPSNYHDFWSEENIYLTKFGQNADYRLLWARRGYRLVSASAEILKIERIIFYYFHKSMKNPKNLIIDYISAAHRVNPPRLGVYFWTLVCPEVVKCMLKVYSKKH
jgi:hypothetical protein